MRTETTPFADRYPLLVVIISAVVASLIHFPEIIALLDIYGRNTLFPGITFTDVFSEVLFTFVSLLLLYGANAILFRFQQARTRVTWWKLMLAFVLTWAMSSLLGQLFVYLHHHFAIPAIDAMVHQYLHPVRDFVMATIVTGSTYVIHVLRQRQAVLIENEQLHAENILNQYEALKNQLNPHMLFNSLNTLRSLVRESPDKAQLYIQELSKVLRYTLQGNEAQTVTLIEEMEFVKAYRFLLEMRYEDNLQFDIAPLDEYGSFHIPPMAIQMLIENAVKHNEISNRKPLTIRIFACIDNFLCISNSIQPKLTPSAPTHVGLANLDKRYHLICHEGIQISNDSEIFRVRIPLISKTANI